MIDLDVTSRESMDEQLIRRRIQDRDRESDSSSRDANSSSMISQGNSSTVKETLSNNDNVSIFVLLVLYTLQVMI